MVSRILREFRSSARFPRLIRTTRGEPERMHGELSARQQSVASCWCSPVCYSLTRSPMDGRIERSPLPDGVAVTRLTLDQESEVRVLVRQPEKCPPNRENLVRRVFVVHNRVQSRCKTSDDSDSRRDGWRPRAPRARRTGLCQEINLPRIERSDQHRIGGVSCLSKVPECLAKPTRKNMLVGFTVQNRHSTL